MGHVERLEDEREAHLTVYQSKRNHGREFREYCELDMLDTLPRSHCQESLRGAVRIPGNQVDIKDEET